MLNRKQFPLYHGSPHELQGDTIRPGVNRGASGAGDTHIAAGQSNKKLVSASENEKSAWDMAAKAGPGRQRVYTVDPNRKQRPGVEHPDNPLHRTPGKKYLDNREQVAPSFKVNGRIDIMPGHQGTFPVDFGKGLNRGGKTAYPKQHPFSANHPAPGSDISRAEQAAYEEESFRNNSEYVGKGNRSKTLERTSVWDDLNSGSLFHDRSGENPHTQGKLF